MQWITIADFSAGIVHNMREFDASSLGYGPGAMGMASMFDTSNCIALPQGGLGPLPSRSIRIGRDDLGFGSVTWYPQFTISAVAAVPVGGPVFDYNFASFEGNNLFLELIIALNGTRTTGERRTRIEQARLWRSSFDANGDMEYFAEGQLLHQIIDASPADLANAVVFFANTRLNPLTPTGTGAPVTIFSYEPPTLGFARLMAFPDPNAQTTLAPVDISTSPRMSTFGIPIVHQNRILLLVTTNSSRGAAASDGQTVDNEKVKIGQVNTWVQESADFTVFGPEQPYGYGSWASISANDLLLIKQQGGAILIQGPATYPIVRTLPGVVPTGGVINIGAQGPAGYCYGVRHDGVYAFNADDARAESSKLLSPQLPPDFWLNHVETEVGAGMPWGGKFAWWGTQLLCPGGWVYDAVIDSWWRLAPSAPSIDDELKTFGYYLDDPSVDQNVMWEVSPIGDFALGCKGKITDNGVDNFYFIDGYTRRHSASVYRWRSQPLFLSSPGRRVSVREFVLVAQGAGKITVRFQTDEAQVTSETIELGDSPDVGPDYPSRNYRPQIIRRRVNAPSSGNVSVIIDAQAQDKDHAAPFVYRLDVGWNEKQHVG